MTTSSSSTCHHFYLPLSVYFFNTGKLSIFGGLPETQVGVQKIQVQVQGIRSGVTGVTAISYKWYFTSDSVAFRNSYINLHVDNVHNKKQVTVGNIICDLIMFYGGCDVFCGV